MWHVVDIHQTLLVLKRFKVVHSDDDIVVSLDVL